jgi:glutathione synthase/RimK-type ligase-like ATP-grasp enzyme
MSKKVLFSVKLDHDVFKNVAKKLKKIQDLEVLEVVLHDPTKEYLNLEQMDKLFDGVTDLIVKVRNECSIDLLHYGKLHDIPTLHDVNTVLMCKNKVALDQALRKVFDEHRKKISHFKLPKSWTQSLTNVEEFKKWATSKLPIVIKSHYQHDKHMRFNFLVKKIEDIDKFCEKYSNFLYYNVYVQEFIECDGIDRKIYVIGEKILGIKRENPIYLYLREKPDNIDVRNIERENYEISDEIKRLAEILSEELDLKIFGFDLLKPIDKDIYYLVDLNDFPGFRSIEKVDDVFIDFFKAYLEL